MSCVCVSRLWYPLWRLLGLLLYRCYYPHTSNKKVEKKFSGHPYARFCSCTSKSQGNINTTAEWSTIEDFAAQWNGIKEIKTSQINQNLSNFNVIQVDILPINVCDIRFTYKTNMNSQKCICSYFLTFHGFLCFNIACHNEYYKFKTVCHTDKCPKLHLYSHFFFFIQTYTNCPGSK